MKVPCSGKVIDETEDELLYQAVNEHWWTEGHFCAEFAELMAKYLGVKYCLPVNSGSSAMLLAVNAVRLKYPNSMDDPYTMINTTPVQFPTTINAILRNGFQPQFHDVSLEDFNIPSMGYCTDRIWCLMHSLGFPSPTPKSVIYIEDNCDSLGAEIDGKKTGSIGDISGLSFYPAHHITSGEGGMVCTNDKELADYVRSLRDWGRDCHCRTGQDNACGHRFTQQFGSLPMGYDHKFVYSTMGYNLKMTEFQGAIGVAQMKKLPFFVKKRRANYFYLAKRFEEEQLTTFFQYVHEQPHTTASPFGFPL